MREIKFRAWDGLNKKMSLNPTFRYEGWEIGCCYFEDNDYYAIEELRIMQFIGLKDKNGKEIYEGDIVKGTWGTSEFDIFKVVFDDEQALFDGEDKEGEPCVFGDYCGAFGSLEVIGNIYENPELLTQKPKLMKKEVKANGKVQGKR